MRLLFLSTWFPNPPDNGSKLRVYYLLRALALAHEVSLLSFAFDTATPALVGPNGKWCHDIQTVEVNPFATNQVGTFRTFLSRSAVVARPIPEMARRAASLLAHPSFDAVIASTEAMTSYALMAPQATARILEEHNSYSRWMHERLSNANGALGRLRCWASWQKARRYERELFRSFDHVTMVSDPDRLASEALAPELRGRISTVPNGVDCEHNLPGLASPTPGALVYSGALSYAANYDAMRWFLAEVYPLIAAQQDVSLTITGSTRGVDLGGLALNDSVSLTGFVEDVRMAVAKASVCVVPIRQGGGTRLKILEAMALGTPVVATTKGAEGLDVKDGEHLLLADDPVTFARLTVELLSNASLRNRLSANARRLVEERYDWHLIGDQFVRVVEQTVAAHGAQRR